MARDGLRWITSGRQFQAFNLIGWSELLILPSIKSAFGSHDSSYSAATVWNKLPLSRSSFLKVYFVAQSYNRVSPRLWNKFPASIRQTCTNLSNSDSCSPTSTTSSIGSIDSPLSPPSPLHSFIHCLKPSFFAAPFHWLYGFPGLFTNTSELIRFYFLVFFQLFSCWFCVAD